MNCTQNAFLTPLISKLVRHRFLKFGSVGFSGMVVNLGVLYLAQEYIFKWISTDGMRLNLSLTLAIFCATINNFTWNRLWTWGERKKEIKKALWVQLVQYFLACWLSIVCQFLITKVIVQFTHYLVANVIAILLAAIINYLLNDVWTFSIKRTPCSTGTGGPCN